MSESVVNTILEVFERNGGEKYADEEVTQLQHALQCAMLAIAEQAPNSLVVAALLHDIGHILEGDELPPSCDVDLHDHHEQTGDSFLRQHFADSVSEPVKLHVSAKRYLCTTQPEYQTLLSPTSLKSFYDQGGLMSEDEVTEFESNPFFKEAIRLRLWDDQAKATDSSEPDIKEFVPRIRDCLASIEK